MQQGDRQALFVAEYLVDRNGAQAAVRAGYSPRSARQIAHRLLTKADVAAAVQEGSQAVATRLGITRDDVLKGLVAAFAAAKAQNAPADMIAACREMARLLGYYPRPSTAGTGDDATRAAETPLEALSDAELLALIAAQGR